MTPILVAMCCSMPSSFKVSMHYHHDVVSQAVDIFDNSEFSLPIKCIFV